MLILSFFQIRAGTPCSCVQPVERLHMIRLQSTAYTDDPHSFVCIQRFQGVSHLFGDTGTTNVNSIGRIRPAPSLVGVADAR